MSRTDESSDPLDSPRPRVGRTELARLLEKAYGLTGELAELHGERDLNFAVEVPGARRYVLKIYNPCDGPDVIEMRSGAMAQVRRLDPGLPIAPVVATLEGDLAAAVDCADGRRCQVQLFSFLEGRHPARDELDEGALYEWGRCVARLGRALRSYFHPAARYAIQWDIRHTASLRDRLPLLEGEIATLATEVIDRFEIHVAGRLEGLRAQVIHNDMSRDNLLVDETCRIVGITDFGDMTYSALACDLAVALADVLDGRSDSLTLAEAMVAGYCSLTPLETGEGEILADLVAARAATAVVVSTWRRTRHDDAPAFPEGAVEMLRLLHEEGFRRAGARLASAAARFGGATRGFRGEGELPYRGREGPELLESRRRVLGPLELSYGEPLHLVRGEGVHVFDASGRSYLDAYNNVPVLGHCHPAVVAAIAAQAGRLVTNTRYLHEAAVELCERLLATAPAGVDRVLLVNSGSEANDLAWQVACHASGARGALVSSFAYHGITEATAALSPEGWPSGVAPSHVALVASPPGAPPGPHGVAASGARAGAGAAGAGAGAFERVATSAEAAVSELAERGLRPAALFADCAFTSEGILGPAPQWVSTAAAAVREVGGLFVADEVQAGYGRSGSHMWSVVATGVEPDLITLGKPMGNGFPVAAVLGRSQMIDPFIEETGYFSTFGGNTLASAAALAVLRVIEDERILDHVSEVAGDLRARLEEVAQRHSGVVGLRSFGLLYGLDVADEDTREDRGANARLATEIVDRLRRLGVLVGRAGPAGSTLKIRPPLVFGQNDAEILSERLDEVLP